MARIGKGRAYWDERKRQKQEALEKYRSEKHLRAKWNDTCFEIGRLFIIKPEKRDNFKELFRQYAKRFEKNVTLKQTVVNGMLHMTVCEIDNTPSIYEKVVAKSGRIYYYKKDRKKYVKKVYPHKKYKRQRFNIKYSKVGDTFIIAKDKCISFQNNFWMFKDKYPHLTWEKERIDDGNFKYTLVPFYIKSKRLSKETINKIITTNATVKEIASMLNLSMGCISKYKSLAKKNLI